MKNYLKMLHANGKAFKAYKFYTGSKVIFGILALLIMIISNSLMASIDDTFWSSEDMDFGLLNTVEIIFLFIELFLIFFLSIGGFGVVILDIQMVKNMENFSRKTGLVSLRMIFRLEILKVIWGLITFIWFTQSTQNIGFSLVLICYVPMNYVIFKNMKEWISFSVNKENNDQIKNEGEFFDKNLINAILLCKIGVIFTSFFLLLQIVNVIVPIYSPLIGWIFVILGFVINSFGVLFISYFCERFEK